jgi:thioredoxin reductase (NADPH)
LAEEYDIVIIGGGPAGLAAGLYAARARRHTLLIEGKLAGGQIALASDVENYPGFKLIGGLDLSQAMLEQAEQHGMTTKYTQVTGIDLNEAGDGKHVVHTEEGDFRAKAIILAGGADYNRLGVPGEDELTGHGVSYCATCDGAFFRDMEVAVVGGGDAAMDEGLFVSRYASKVTVIHRRDTLRASAILQERAFANPKMKFIWDTIVERIDGDKDVSTLHLKNVKTGAESDLPVAGVFIFIGQTPNTSYLPKEIELDNGRHVVVNLWMETSAPGVFAAGDIRGNSARQVVSAAGDGATAAVRADHYIGGHFKE